MHYKYHHHYEYQTHFCTTTTPFSKPTDKTLMRAIRTWSLRPAHSLTWEPVSKKVFVPKPENHIGFEAWSKLPLKGTRRRFEGHWYTWGALKGLRYISEEPEKRPQTPSVGGGSDAPLCVAIAIVTIMIQTIIIMISSTIIIIIIIIIIMNNIIIIIIIIFIIVVLRRTSFARRSSSRRALPRDIPAASPWAWEVSKGVPLRVNFENAVWHVLFKVWHPKNKARVCNKALKSSENTFFKVALYHGPLISCRWAPADPPSVLPGAIPLGAPDPRQVASPWLYMSVWPCTCPYDDALMSVRLMYIYMSVWRCTGTAARPCPCALGHLAVYWVSKRGRGVITERVGPLAQTFASEAPRIASAWPT